MPRIIGKDIPAKKRLVISLQSIYGLGEALAKEVILKLQLDSNMPAENLTESDVARINQMLQSEYLVEGDLRRKVKRDIDRLIEIGSYRGQRHRAGLPVRGQGTQKNARTRKGKKKTVANKKM
ncbi:MAG: 30S ribosomal protein S13 [Chlamydiota bacterium]